MSKKVLVIAYYFPPMGMGGVRRVVSFCKYLPQKNWSPIVLSVKNIKYFINDDSFLREINYPVVRTESADPLRLLKSFNLKTNKKNVSSSFHKLSSFMFIPDNKIGWFPYALKSGLNLIKKHKPDVIFASAPPYTSLLIGYYLKKLTKLPLVVEFRDPWPYSSYPTFLHKKINESLKTKVLKPADAVITINKVISKNLPPNTIIIPPGYDPDDFINKNTHKPSSKHKFTITYTGSFFPPRTPEYFLKALSELTIENPSLSEDIKLELIGLHSTQEQETIKKLNLENIVEIIPYLPHNECIQKLIASDLLWIMIDNVEDTASTGKIGEYLGAGKPILATVPEGPCADIINETRTGMVVPPRDIQAIKKAIYDFYLKYKSKSHQTGKPESYSWQNLTSKLTDIFDSLT
ncbi:MAG: glycosyltransferase family 4 protein [bacterium]